MKILNQSSINIRFIHINDLIEILDLFIIMKNEKKMMKKSDLQGI